MRALYLGIAVFIVGCSADDEKSPQVSSADIAAARCDRLAACAPVRLRADYGDLERCRTRMKLSVDSTLAVAVGADAAACRAALNAATCDEVLSATFPPAACRFTGSIENGRGCGIDAQCKSGFCTKARCGGVCVDAPKEGEPCADSRCAAGQRCLFDRCVMLGAEGAPCISAYECELTLSCVGGSCTRRATLGEPCAEDSSKPACDANSTCDTSGTCVETTLAKPGEPCGRVGSAFVWCELGQCVITGPTSPCRGYIADGQPCSVATTPCFPPATCVDNVCQVFNGTTCK